MPESKRVKPKGLMMKRSKTYGKYMRAFTVATLAGYGIAIELYSPDDYAIEGNDIFIRSGTKLEFFLLMRNAI